MISAKLTFDAVRWLTKKQQARPFESALILPEQDTGLPIPYSISATPRGADGYRNRFTLNWRLARRTWPPMALAGSRHPGNGYRG